MVKGRRHTRRNTMEDNDAGSSDNSDGSNSSSDEDVVHTIALLAPYLRAYYAKEPRNTSVLQGSAYFTELVESTNESRFYDMARMRRETFFSLLQKLESTGRLRSSRRVSSGEKLMILLRVLTRTSNRASGERWQLSGATISSAVNEVVTALLSIQTDLIQPPTAATPSQISGSPKFYPYFKNCVGAIDGTHIHAIVPSSLSPSFRNRKGFVSQNVLAACNFDMVFCYVMAGWEGSVHDGRVFNHALTHGFPRVPGKYYLADAGYSLSYDTLTPYRGVRYHLNEWAAGNQKPQTKEELFNLRHASLRNVIERAFGVFKKKFPLMQTMLPYPFETQVNLVMAATVVYNFIRMVDEPFGPLDSFNTAVTDSDNNIGVSDTQERDVDDGVKAFRDDIATRMWSDYIVYLAGRDNSVVV